MLRKIMHFYKMVKRHLGADPGANRDTERLKLYDYKKLSDKYKDINANSKTVLTDYAMLKLVLYSPNMFLLFCQSKVGVV